MLFSVQQCGNINVRGLLIVKTNNFARIVNACLYFVMATVPYSLYMLIRLYLNTTYTVSSIKNVINRLIQMTIRYIATNGVTIITVGADNICLVTIIHFVQ